ncbi:PfkB family carbohydrate kinase [Agromyces sp. Marseille-P2726]|uniref:PfkB family carbohydrate kinase n=1 Tax=Agromyces sp. Marseille-P2726 TaxID=2709132 RepID=UPI00156F9DCD|nr:PfkB family carbohydrate kinase [Agromyces sp. Marseille-P2726]
MADVLIFAPAPLLTVTLEGDAASGDLHIHSGGQGIWQARMLRTLGRSVAIAGAFTGEPGRVVQHLLHDEGIEVHAVEREGRGSAYVHDRRSGERVAVAELAGDPLSRHDLDELYAVMLREAMNASLVILSGPADDGILPDDVYRRLAADVTAAGRPVVVDLAGTRLASALEGGVRLAKVSDSELRDAGELEGDSVDELVQAGRRMRDAGAESVLITRAHEPALLIDGDEAVTVRVPQMQEVDSAGAGDSFTAAVVAALAAGDSLQEAVALGAAAGALNVTRHGLGTGDHEAIQRLRERVDVRPVGDQGETAEEAEIVSPDQLAARAEVDER